MKRKNKLKATIDSCFICGKDLECLEDKIGHRINPKKGNNEHNLLIVCKECKKILSKHKIYDIYIDKAIIDKYFKDKDTKKIILNKIRIMEKKDD